ncbi:hypothetical protein TCA2_4588 [Paenibacillus sp. TCA20]|uniref:Uncharacterized protein n=1 Tax=Paenibacillus urinalis TaxID=521520 RepID=A0ABY7XH32_9BACL|nr:MULTISPECIES: hypothetical protein [Paenibacillus]WDI05078.1 hypothetical protein PUW25_26270 [Paenibacillus urinalis]GAK42096.1 hypothetical protein TCA2_4588 [Paenibacillus sp. TCA20]
MSEVKPAVLIFKEELEQFNDPEIQSFTQNALSMAPESFYNDEELVTYTKNVYRILMGFLGEESKIRGLADAFRAGALLQDLCFNETGDAYRRIHPVMVRTFLAPLKKDLQTNIFDAILGMVESHEADQSPSPLLEPKPTNSAFLLAMANKVARFNFIEFKD